MERGEKLRAPDLTGSLETGREVNAGSRTDSCCESRSTAIGPALPDGLDPTEPNADGPAPRRHEPIQFAMPDTHLASTDLFLTFPSSDRTCIEGT